MDDLKWIQEWYRARLNSEWEEYYGIKIDTLDNPGWIVMIDVAETEYENKVFNPYILNNGENDWIDCKIENGCFIGAGDSSKLLEIVALFRKWIESV